MIAEIDDFVAIDDSVAAHWCWHLGKPAIRECRLAFCLAAEALLNQAVERDGARSFSFDR